MVNYSSYACEEETMEKITNIRKEEKIEPPKEISCEVDQKKEEKIELPKSFASIHYFSPYKYKIRMKGRVGWFISGPERY